MVATKILKGVKKAIEKTKTQKRQKFSTEAEARKAAIDAGKKTFNIGLKDLKTGDLTEAEFKEALKNQFDGLTQEDLNDLIKKADEGDASDIQLESGPAQEIDVLDPDNKEELKSLKVDDESGKTVSNQDKEKDKNKELPPFIPAEKVEQITEYTDKDGKTTVDNPKTPQNEAVIAQLGLGRLQT